MVAPDRFLLGHGPLRFSSEQRAACLPSLICLVILHTLNQRCLRLQITLLREETLNLLLGLLIYLLLLL